MKESLKLVGVGASAGGLDALIEFFKVVPGNCGSAFLVIQHQCADHASMMHELLAPHTKLPVVEAIDGMTLEGGAIYLCPPGMVARVKQLTLELEARPQDKSVVLSIDILFESMGETLGAACAGVVLSGTGADGTQGILGIERGGGIVAAQSPETAAFTGMPQSAIASGKCHITAPPGEIWGEIADYAATSGVPSADEAPQSTGEHAPLPFEPDDYARIFRYLEGRFDLDFSLYRINSVSRRLSRRMDLLGVPDVGGYLEYLEKNDSEAKDLYQDLLIGVTGFFRDAASFESLNREAMRSAMTAEREQDFRIWSAGCATGQEAYSLYMLADEVKREVGYSGRIIVFATDVFKPSTDFGSEGVYRAEDVEGLGAGRIERYFQEFDAGHFKIRSHVRDDIVFARHNLLTDPPFTNMDIVSCRNVLIYLKPEVQEAALSAFLFSLRERGFLFLGGSESLGKLERSFKVISNRARIYQKNDGHSGSKRWPDLLVPAPKSKQVGSLMMGTSVTINRDLLNAYDLLLGRFAPCGFLINVEREVLHYFGDAADFCINVFGRVNPDLTEQLDKPLRLVVTTMVHKARRKNERAVARGIHCSARNGPRLVDVVVEPLRDRHGEVRNVLIEIHDRETQKTTAPPEASKAGKSPAARTDALPAAEQVERLEAELKLAREHLEAANEELQVSNNELQTMNEELQTMNEELQSTNEELHSLNEELTTLNAEYERKNHDLARVNASHENLLESIEDGVLDVDKEMRIRRYNTAIKSAFSLKPIDLGRPLRDIAYKMEDRDSILDGVRSVLESGGRVEGETTLKDGRCFMKRITPCHDEAGKIDGALLTYTEVTVTRRMEKRFKFALQTARLSWWDWNLSEDLLDVTSGGDCLLGEGCLNVSLGRSGWMKHVHPDDRDTVRRTLEDCLEGRTGEWSCEHRFRTGSEQWLWVRNQGIVTRRDERGDPLEMMGTTQDVDALKRALVEAENQQAILAAADEISKVGTWDYDPETHEVFGSDQTSKILEVDGQFLPSPEKFFELVHAEDRERLQTAFERMIADGTPYDLQLRVRTPKGRELLCRSAARARYDETGRIARVVGIFQDITELTWLQRELEAFFNLSPDFQARLAINGSFQFCSPSWERELGYKEQELFSMQLSDMVHEADRPAFRKIWDKVAAGATVTNYETRVISKSGTEPGCGMEQPWISWSFSSEPKLAMVFVSARDVTAQKEAEKALQEARLRAEEANRAKSDFLAVMSHELRTPLNPILGFADMLIEEVESGEHREILQTIVESGNHMLSLIDEILEYSKIDAGKTRLEPAEFTLEEFVEQKVHLMSGQIKDAPIKLSRSIDWGPVDQSRAPVWVGDVGMLRQVCRNLISNAIKFTRQGRVDFDVAVQELEGDRALVRFDVRDSGIGIAEKDRSKLFKPFTQVQSGLSREYGGTGLGLAICKRLVELMDGSISVDSKVGEGSTFSFTLPLLLRYNETKVQSTKESDQSRVNTLGDKLRGNVLLVEDNESNAYYIKKLVEMSGVIVEWVVQGESALEQLLEHDFDLVLLDLHMPGMGGLETLKRIRSSEKNRIKKLPVIILTADASIETERECQENGSDGFLIKPVRPRVIHEMLEEHLGSS